MDEWPVGTGNRSAALEISSHFEQYRKVSVLYCGRKRIGALVAYKHMLVFWIAGGRSGSHREMMAEWEQNLDDFEDSYRSAVKSGDREAIEKSEKAIEGTKSRIHQWTDKHWPAVSLAGAWRVAEVRSEDVTFPAVSCRRCRHDHQVILHSDNRLEIVKRS